MFRLLSSLLLFFTLTIIPSAHADSTRVNIVVPDNGAAGTAPLPQQATDKHPSGNNRASKTGYIVGPKEFADLKVVETRRHEHKAENGMLTLECIMRLLAENGDEMTVAVTVSPISKGTRKWAAVVAPGTWRLIAGRGRFAKATGKGKARAFFPFKSDHVLFSLAGMPK